MKMDFYLEIQDDPYNKNFFSFLNPQHKQFLADILEFLIIEKASRKALENWQLAQLNNLFDYAKERSEFWRNRLPDHKITSYEDLKSIPLLTRENIKQQVESEGCLAKEGEEGKIGVHHTSGSSGVAIKFFHTEKNREYDTIRSITRQIMGNLETHRNQVRLFASSYIEFPGFKTQINEGLGIHGFMNTGKRRFISYSNPDMKLFIEEIRKEEIGYMIVNPYMMQTLLQYYSAEEMKRDGLYCWIPIGGACPKDIREELNKHDIKIMCNYSSEELGFIGYECNENPDHYHVTTSNVFVETDGEELILDGNKVKKLVITKLFGTATPFIRYDIGDLGELLDKCPCGHDGPTIRNLHGRSKCLVKRKDGSIYPFLIQVKNHTFMSNYKEYRFIQTDLNTIRIQIGGIDTISEEEVKQWAGVVYDQVGKDEFQIEIELLDQIDWGGSKKKIPFKSLVI